MNNLNKRVKQIPYGLTKEKPAPRLKKISVLMVLSFFLGSLAAAEVKNPDTPLQGDWDLNAKKIWEVSTYGKKVMAMPGVGAVLDDGTLCVFDWKRKDGKNDSYTIYVMNQEGIVSNRFSIDRKKRNFTIRMKKELQKEIALSPAQLKRFPGYLTEFNKIQILDGLVLVYVIYFGEYWVEQQIDIFSLDGKYLYRTRFKPGNGEEIFITRHKVIIKDGFLYAPLMDAEGNMKVVKYQVSLPGNSLTMNN